MNDEKRNFLKFMIEIEKARITNFLTNNPEIMASALVEQMISMGLLVAYVSLITGVSIEEINRLKNIRH
jgi:hypothetical protein